MKTLILLLLSAAMACAAPPLVRIRWDAYEDATATTFSLHYGAEPGNYSTAVVIPVGEVDLAEPSWTIEDLEPGTYFMALTASNSFGMVSEFSNEITFTIPPRPIPPGGLKLNLTIQTSSNQIDWRDIAMIGHQADSADRAFYRIAVRAIAER